MRVIPLFACCLMLSGCLFSPAPAPPEAPPALRQALTPAAQFITENAPGAAGSVFDESFGGQARVSVEEEFVSASGRLCRRASVSRQSRDTEFVVFCRTEAGWEMMPRIWGGKIE